MKCTEKNYISRLKKGKEDALEFIVDKYLGLVKSAVYKVLSSLEVNILFLKIYMFQLVFYILCLVIRLA